MRGEYSLADISAATGGNRNDGFGGDGAWWIILFLIFGFGRNGFGNGFGGNGIGENYALATDFANIERKLDGVNNGICDSTFALNNTVTNGFAGVQNTLCQGFNGLNMAYLQGQNTLSSQLANCCCDLKAQLADCCCTTQRAIDGVNYNMATNTCAITNAINTSTRDMIDNQNANYRAIHDELIANKLEMKNDRIDELTAQVNKLQLAASQSAQNAYLLNELKPCPSAAYIVPNPNCCYNYTVTQNSCGSQFI